MIFKCNSCLDYCLLNDNLYDGGAIPKYCPMNGRLIEWKTYKPTEKKKTEKNDIDYNLMIDRLDTIIDLLDERLM